MTPDQVLDMMAVAEEIKRHDADNAYVMDALNTFRLTSMLQLVLRHPHLPADAAKLARDMIGSAKQLFDGCPNVLRTIERGFNPEHDYDPTDDTDASER